MFASLKKIKIYCAEHFQQKSLRRNPNCKYKQELSPPMSFSLYCYAGLPKQKRTPFSFKICGFNTSREQQVELKLPLPLVTSQILDPAPLEVLECCSLKVITTFKKEPSRILLSRQTQSFFFLGVWYFFNAFYTQAVVPQICRTV